MSCPPRWGPAERKGRGPTQPWRASWDVTLGASSGLVRCASPQWNWHLTTPRATHSSHSFGSGLHCSHSRCSLWEAFLCQGCACQLWLLGSIKMFLLESAFSWLGDYVSPWVGWGGLMFTGQWHGARPCAECMATVSNPHSAVQSLHCSFCFTHRDLRPRKAC